MGVLSIRFKFQIQRAIAGPFNSYQISDPGSNWGVLLINFKFQRAIDDPFNSFQILDSESNLGSFDFIITETYDFYKKNSHFDVLWFILASEACRIIYFFT